MIYVEIELNGVVCPKRCERYVDSNGFYDYNKIREYFTSLGYVVGSIKIS
ncbi:hypothetical protein ZPAH1_orf00019 [Aeromonas phage ZPAH1]|nr:hypothetical protein ZPAH1_orf00019 [Aeromonas phage ZPAH1]